MYRIIMILHLFLSSSSWMEWWKLLIPISAKVLSMNVEVMHGDTIHILLLAIYSASQK